MLRSAPVWIALGLAGGTALMAGTVETPHTGGDRDEAAMIALGERLFHDTALSQNGTQSCATCHDPAHAFTDPREGRAGTAVSVGDDGESHGDRNAPTLSYASFSPGFHLAETGHYKGGQFWDGRATDLAEQAVMPLLNPVEMGITDKTVIVDRLRDDPAYVAGFDAVFGAGTLADPERTFDAMAEALAAFQATPDFAPFDSKYDRWLRGEVEFTAQEEFGHTVFVTWNCRLCHMARKQGVAENETFTNFEYHNIGVPVNALAREASGMGPDYVDEGLLAHPRIDDPAERGKFKVPSLRNVAVTGPYMHNGVLSDLRTVVLFYNQYTSSSPRWKINPETDEDWGGAEVSENLSLTELESGLSIDDRRIDALVAFLETLTDRRYEPLLEEIRAERQTVAAR